jgi:hypothetical protein
MLGNWGVLVHIIAAHQQLNAWRGRSSLPCIAGVPNRAYALIQGG